MNYITAKIKEKFQNEPINLYADPQDRLALKQEIENFQVSPTPHASIVGGKEHPTSETFTSTNPNNPSQVLGTFSRLGTDPQVIKNLVESASNASKQFAAIPIAKRVEALKHVASVLKEQKLKLNAALVLEVGKSPVEADGDTAEAIDFANYYAVCTELILTEDDLTPSKDPFRKMVNLPWGPILSVDPFNFPIAIAVGQATLALSGGNSVIMKPSIHASLCGTLVYRALIEGLKRAGIEIPGLVNIVYGRRQEIQLILKQDGIKGFNFTGGRAGARGVLSLAQNVDQNRTPGQGFFRVQPLAFEANGVNQCTILADANIDEAVKASVAAQVGFSGQKCSARSWTVVQDSIYDEFKTKFVDAMQNVPVGSVIPAESGYNPMGAVISQQALKQLESQMKIFLDHGARIIANENYKVEGSGHCMKPVVLEMAFEDIKQNPHLRSIEMFGPISVLTKVQNFEQAMELENMSEYALTGSLFTNDANIIERWMRESRVGNKYLNRKETGALVGQSFGGGGDSDSGLGGIKGAGGPFTVLKAVNQKCVVGNYPMNNL